MRKERYESSHSLFCKLAACVPFLSLLFCLFCSCSFGFIPSNRNFSFSNADNIHPPSGIASDFIFIELQSTTISESKEKRRGTFFIWSTFRESTHECPSCALYCYCKRLQ